VELDAASRGFGLEIGGDGVDLERHDGPHVILITDEFCERTIEARNGKWNCPAKRTRTFFKFGARWYSVSRKAAAAKYPRNMMLSDAVMLPPARRNPA
jgi:hypothetical protein